MNGVQRQPRLGLMKGLFSKAGMARLSTKTRPLQLIA